MKLKETHEQMSSPLKGPSTVNMWAETNPPRVPEVDWIDARDRLYYSWDDRKEMAKAMNIAQEAYYTLKDTTGNKGRQFAE